MRNFYDSDNSNFDLNSWTVDPEVGGSRPLAHPTLLLAISGIYLVSVFNLNTIISAQFNIYCDTTVTLEYFYTSIPT